MKDTEEEKPKRKCDACMFTKFGVKMKLPHTCGKQNLPKPRIKK